MISEKKWFPQDDPTESALVLLKTLIFYSGINIPDLTVESDIKNHNEYPNITLEGLREIIKKWGIDSIRMSLEFNKLRDLPPLSIICIYEREDELRNVEMVMFYHSEDDDIEYLHPKKGWIVEDIEEVESKWSKLVLVITGINKIQPS